MAEGKTFSLSANGDSWSLETDPSTGEAIVLHKANSSSGGHETRRSIDEFLAASSGKPEHDSLLQILGRSEDDGPTSTSEVATPSYATAMRYLELGGSRLASADDNIVSTRAWDIDPMDAEAFWQANVEGLAEKEKQEVVLHLPSVSDADTDAEGNADAQSRPTDHSIREKPDAT